MTCHDVFKSRSVIHSLVWEWGVLLGGGGEKSLCNEWLIFAEVDMRLCRLELPCQDKPSRKVMFLLKRFSSLKKLHLNKREGEGWQESCCLPSSSLIHTHTKNWKQVDPSTASRGSALHLGALSHNGLSPAATKSLQRVHFWRCTTPMTKPLVAWPRILTHAKPP